jgi:hypothetical protein
MDWVIETLDEPDQPIILFANINVLDFHPRFGFPPAPTASVFRSRQYNPFRMQALRCDPASAVDRLRLANLCARARPIRGPLAARNYYPALLWRLTSRPVTAFWLHDLDAAVAAILDGQRRVVHDVIAIQPFDLKPVIPPLMADPMTDLEFCFDPEDWWPSADHSELNDSNRRLFGRGKCFIHPRAGPIPGIRAYVTLVTVPEMIEVTFINVEVMEYFKKFLLRNHFILERTIV